MAGSDQGNETEDSAKVEPSAQSSGELSGLRIFEAGPRSSDLHIRTHAHSTGSLVLGLLEWRLRGYFRSCKMVLGKVGLEHNDNTKP